jgi:hypothetical protein
MLGRSLLATRNYGFMTSQFQQVRRNMMLTSGLRVFSAKGSAIPEGFQPPSFGQAGDLLKVNYTEEFD